MIKNRILSIMLVISVCIMTIPLYASADSGISAVYDSGMLTVTLPFTLTGSAMVVAAAYDKDGKMIDVISERLSSGANNAVFDNIANASHYRAFLFDDLKSIKPVTKPASAVNNGAVVTMRALGANAPTLNDNVAAAISSAVDARAEAELAMNEVWPLLDADNMETYPITRTVNSEGMTYTETIHIPEGEWGDVNEALDLIENAQKAYMRAYKAAAVAEIAADKASLNNNGSTYSLFASSDATKWANEITSQWDAIQGKGKLKKFADDLGCDARRAYKLLTMAQNILQGNYANDEGDLYETCEKTAMAVKTGAKVGVYVCATVATGGTAAAAGGFTAGQAAGILVGEVDCLIEVSSTTSKIIMGPDNKVSKKFDETMSPITNATFLFSLFTGGGDTAAEKMLFLGDLAEKGKDGYEYVKAKWNESTKQVETDVLRIESSDGNAIKKEAESILGKDEAGFGTGNSGKTANEQLSDFSKNRSSADITLSTIYSKIKTEAKSYKDMINDFIAKCDKTLKDEGLDINTTGKTGGGGSGGGGGGATDDSSGTMGSGGPEYDIPPEPPVPTPDTDDEEDDDPFSRVEVKYNEETNIREAEYYYNDNGKLVKQINFDKDGNIEREWITCSGGTKKIHKFYYAPGAVVKHCYYPYSNDDEESTVYMTAECAGIVSQRWAERLVEGNWINDGDTIGYYPTGQVNELRRFFMGAETDRVSYSPNGLLRSCSHGTDLKNGTYVGSGYSYTYYTHPAQNKNGFNPTGYLGAYGTWENSKKTYEITYRFSGPYLEIRWFEGNVWSDIEVVEL